MTTTHPQDAGTEFGTWDDPTARLMYEESTPDWMAALHVDAQRLTVDLGGANGLLRHHFHRLVTVDQDATKEPDVVADARTWQPQPHLSARPVQAILRYVLHYLDDADALAILAAAARYADTLHLVQFTNEDTAAKYANSRHEGPRYFRTSSQLTALALQAPQWWPTAAWMGTPYTVTPDFYRARLGPGEYTPHEERITALTLTRKDARP